MRRPRNPVRRLLGQILVIAPLISALTLVPIRPAAAQGVAGSWSYTGSLNTERYGHTATLLPNGKVLVAGGSRLDINGNPFDLNSAELYDPATGTWSYIGSLNTARAHHTATLLPNGKVLVEGGETPDAWFIDSAELYDPATGAWSYTGRPQSRLRFDNTATLLPNGKVLKVTGNTLFLHNNTGSRLDTVELYDPGTGTWSFTRNLNADRFLHTATLLQNGNVMVTGGRVNGAFNSEIYDPITGLWSNVQGGTSRWYHTATLLPNGKVLVAGGYELVFPNARLASAEIYDPATGLMSGTSQMINARAGHRATLLQNGKVLATGDGAELYDPATGTWNATASPNSAYGWHTATLLNNGKVLVVRGTIAELYDPTCSMMLAPTSRNFAASGGTGLITVTATEGCAGTVATVSAASYRLTALASEAIATSFGAGLANATSPAAALPLPTEIAGTTIKIRDSTGAERLAPLLYVSPTQVNYQIPTGTATGVVTVTITSGDGSVSNGIAPVKPVAPSLFAANGDGQGVAAAFAVRVKADGSQSSETIAHFDAAQNRFIARPLDLGPESDQVYLVLFGTGIRSRRSLSSVIATIGGTYAAVSFAEAQPDFAGLDQVTVLIPRSLIERGEVDVLLTVEAQMANPVRVNIR